MCQRLHALQAQRAHAPTSAPTCWCILPVVPLQTALFCLSAAGGSSIQAFLNRSGVRHVHEVHIHPFREEQALPLPKYDHGPVHKRVVVTLRDPVARVVSAFNWRHTDGGGPVRRPGETLRFERELYGCFARVDAFARALVHGEAPSPACLVTAETAIDPTRWAKRLPSFHMGMGYRYHLPAATLEIVATNSSLYALRFGRIADDAIGLMRWLNGTFFWQPPGLTEESLQRIRLPAVRAVDYPRRHDRIEDDATALALARKLIDEYHVVARLLCHANVTMNVVGRRDPVPAQIGHLQVLDCATSPPRMELVPLARG